MKTEKVRGDWVGQVIDGKYTLLRWLGGSELSGVFLTELAGDQPQNAAIRLVAVDGAEADAQLSRWTAARTLAHPHLMKMLDAGRCQIGDNRLLYAVTEYAGEKLSEILPERSLTADETREMLEPVLDAVAYLHGKGFVHGRLKPSKIMVVNDQVKLSIDDAQAPGKLDRLEQAKGVYDAPECALGTISPASDFWSLGVTLVEALTQHPPVWDRTAQSDPTVPESVQEPFAGIARELLHIDPARRCGLDDVKARLSGASSQQKPAAESYPEASSGFRGWMIAAMALVVIALIAVFYPRSHQEPQTQSSTDMQSEPAASKPSAGIKSDTANSTPTAETNRKATTPAPQEEAKSEVATPAPAAPSAAQEKRGSGGASMKGEVAERVQPELLPKAVASIQGQVNVKVRVTVDANGAVSDAALDSQGPSKYFAKAAVDAAKRWRFKPAQVKGEDAASVWMLQFRFKREGTEVTPVEVAP